MSCGSEQPYPSPAGGRLTYIQAFFFFFFNSRHPKPRKWKRLLKLGIASWKNPHTVRFISSFTNALRPSSLMECYGRTSSLLFRMGEQVERSVRGKEGRKLISNLEHIANLPRHIPAESPENRYNRIKAKRGEAQLSRDCASRSSFRGTRALTALFVREPATLEGGPAALLSHDSR